MNNIELGTQYIKDNEDRICYFYVCLGHKNKLYGLYLATFGGNPIWTDADGRTVYSIQEEDLIKQHLFHLSADFAEAIQKAKGIVGNYALHTVQGIQNPYDFKTPEELERERRFRVCKDDVFFFARMSRRWDSNSIDRQREDFEVALSKDEDFKSHSHKLKRKLYKRAKNRVIVDTKNSWKFDIIENAKKSKYMGDIGEKVTKTLVCTGAKSFQNQWNGWTNMMFFKDEDGNVVNYFGSKDFVMYTDDDKDIWVEKGDTVVIEFKVKQHFQYKPATLQDRPRYKNFSIKQTKMERPKLLEIIKSA